MHAITKLRRDIESSRRRMQVVLSPSAEKLGRQIMELAARRKRKREQQEGSRINDQKELFEEKL
jgi:hypothetical protein